MGCGEGGRLLRSTVGGGVWGATAAPSHARVSSKYGRVGAGDPGS